MSEDVKRLYDERLGRYQATIALEPTDRMPIAPGSNSFAETYSGCSLQEIVYDGDKWIEAATIFMRDFPETDVLRPLRVWGPIYDVMGCNFYSMTGRELPPNTQYQFIEKENMLPEEYDLFIKDPLVFIVERFFPRVFDELAKPGSGRSYIAFLKGGMAYMMRREYNRKKAIHAEKVLGAPLAMSGMMLAPFDFLSDVFRGLKGILTDLYRCPEKVLDACEAVIPLVVHGAISAGDPLRRYPIQMPFHKACFLSPKQFDTFYWPSLKKAMMMLIDAGFTIRAYLEGSWSRHWHHFLELPKGKVICDIDNQDDIFQAKKEIGHHVCLAGGLPDSLMILGSPQDVRERVKLLCETVGKDGGYIINCGCNIPRDTKPENFRAMIDAIMEYGWYDRSIKPTPRIVTNPPKEIKGLPELPLLTSWEVKREELGGSVLGDEDLIRRHWEMFEKHVFAFLMLWTV